MRPRGWLLVLGLPWGLLVQASHALSQSPPPRTDLHGDWLPSGAVARLGTERLRPGRDTLALTFSGDGKVLASAHNRGHIELWDGVTGKHLGSLTSPTGANFTCLAASPDGKHLAAGDVAHGIWLWELGTAKEPRLLEGHHAALRELSFSPDSALLASVARANSANDPPDYTVRLWDVASARPLHALVGHVDRLTSVAFLKDGKQLLSLADDGTMRVWESATGKELDQHEVEGWALRPLPDGNKVAVLNREDQSWVALYDLAEGKWLPRILLASVSDVAAAPDGKQLAVANGDGLYVLETASGKVLHHFLPHVHRFDKVAFAQGGKRLAASTPARLYLWDTTTGRETTSPAAHYSDLQMVRFLPDGKRVLTFAGDNSVRLWDAATGQPLHHFALPANAYWGNTIDLSPDGRILAVAKGSDRQVVLWDIAKGQPTATLDTGGYAQTSSVVFSPDGKTLAVTAYRPSADYRMPPIFSVRLLDIAGKLLHALDEEFRRVRMVFSPDGKFLVTEDHFVRLWDVATGKLVKQLPKGNWPLFVLPDPSVVALATGERYGETGITWWNVKTGQLTIGLPQSPDTCFLGVAPDGNQVVFHKANAVKDVLWLREPTTGKLLARLVGHRGCIQAVAFSPDGKWLATGAADGTALVWDLPALLKEQRQRHPPLTAGDLEKLWTDLGTAKPGQLLEVMDCLVEASEATLSLFRKRLSPVSDARLENRLADLDSSKFSERDQATRELAHMEYAAAAALQRHLAANPSLEVRQRVEKLLKQLQEPVRAAVVAGVLAAVTVLEQIDNPQARELLESLAQGSPSARLTELARAALVRVAKRAPGGFTNKAAG